MLDTVASALDSIHGMNASSGAAGDADLDPARAVFRDGRAALDALSRVGYKATIGIAECVVTCSWDDKPILLEGPPGAGKTELAHAVSRATGMPIITLQCYDGITPTQAFGDFSRPLQELFARAAFSEGTDLASIRDQLNTRTMFLPGPLLTAIEATQRVILLIDEVDKVDAAFESALLEVLSKWTITIPGLGAIQSATRPFCILTSNRARATNYDRDGGGLTAPLLSRCQYILVEYPSIEMEAEIIAKQTPELNREAHLFMATFAGYCRKQLKLFQKPGIREMLDVAKKLSRTGRTSFTEDDAEILIPLLFKDKRDVQSMRQRSQESGASQFGAVLRMVNREFRKDLASPKQGSNM